MLYVNPENIASEVADPMGNASTSLAIPANPILTGITLSAQVAAWDFALVGLALPVGTSNAIEITIGSGN